MVQDLVDNSIKTANRFPVSLLIPPHESGLATAVALIEQLLINRGMICWTVIQDDGLIAIEFRPFNYELDTSIFATLHH
jgi:hypothetical protein